MLGCGRRVRFSCISRQPDGTYYSTEGLDLENTAGRCESPTLCVQASLSGNGRRMWAVLTTTGRIEVLVKET